MGYKLTSLVNLPFDEKINFYIFSIGDGIWQGGLQEIVNKNFDGIARRIGPNAIIVADLEFEFHGEVVQKYLGKHHRELKNELPALLITNSHPDKLTDDSLRLLIPLKKADNNYSDINNFFVDIAAYVKGESDDLLKNLEAKNTIISTADGFVKLTWPLIPGVVEANLGKILIKLKECWKNKKK